MELDIWGSTRCTSAHYDENAHEWTVSVTRAGKSLTLRPQQLVLGNAGYRAQSICRSIAGAERFRGQQYHSSEHRSGWRGLRASVVS